MNMFVKFLAVATLAVGLVASYAFAAASSSGASSDKTCWEGINNDDGTGGNKKCEITEKKGEANGTAKHSHTTTDQGGHSTTHDDGTNTYSQDTGNTASGDDHYQFSADGKTMTHTHYTHTTDADGHTTTTSTTQKYKKVPCTGSRAPAPDPVEL